MAGALHAPALWLTAGGLLGLSVRWELTRLAVGRLWFRSASRWWHASCVTAVAALVILVSPPLLSSLAFLFGVFGAYFLSGMVLNAALHFAIRRRAADGVTIMSEPMRRSVRRLATTWLWLHTAIGGWSGLDIEKALDEVCPMVAEQRANPTDPDSIA